MTRLTFALLAVALVTMLVFEDTITRVIGVLALFGFIVAGTFAIANHEFLDPGVDNRPARNDETPVPGSRATEEG